MIPGVSDVVPKGDDAKIRDRMSFYSALCFVPGKIFIVMNECDQEGTLFAWAIVASEENPTANPSNHTLAAHSELLNATLRGVPPDMDRRVPGP